MGKITERLKRWLLRETPQTASPDKDSNGTQFGHWFAHYQQRPQFSIFAADLMLFDQQVWFGLCVGNGPLMSAEVEVTGPSNEINQFVGDTFDKIWSSSASKILAAKYYGYAGHEVMYREQDGRIEFDKLCDLHPLDTRVLIGRDSSKVLGQRVRNLGGGGYNNASGQIDLWAPKSLWITYDARYGKHYGWAILERAYGPWWDKAMEGGAYALRRLRMVKDAWIGDVIYYDQAHTFVSTTGEQIHARDMAREVGENRHAGGVLALPMVNDGAAGNRKLLEYEPPTAVAGATQINEWIHDLDWDIFDGLLLPKEVVEAATSGSGFSGRSIPFLSFLSTRDVEFAEDVRQIKEQVIDPLVILNYGEGAKRQYEIKPKPLLETVGKQMGDMGRPNVNSQAPQEKEPGQGQGGGMPPQLQRPGQPAKPGQPMQFGADGPEKGQWVTMGGSDHGDSKHKGGTPVKVHRGKIVAGPYELTGKRMAEIADKKRPDSATTDAIRQAARQWRVNRRDLRDAVDWVHSNKLAVVQEREAAKKRARELTGLTVADHSRLSNAGKDHTAVKGFDTAARQIASEHPELGLGRGTEEGGRDDTDYSAAVWDLLGEGKREPLPKHHPDIVDEAAQLVIEARKGEKPSDDDDPVPFSVGEQDSLAIAVRRRICQLLDPVQFADRQRSLWDEDEHPRAKGGEFTKKGEGEKKSESGLASQSENVRLSESTKEAPAVEKHPGAGQEPSKEIPVMSNVSETVAPVKIERTSSMRKVDAYAPGKVIEHDGHWLKITGYNRREDHQGGYVHTMKVQPATDDEAKAGRIEKIERIKRGLKTADSQKDAAEWNRLDDEQRHLEGRPSQAEEAAKANADREASLASLDDGDVYDRMDAAMNRWLVANKASESTLKEKAGLDRNPMKFLDPDEPEPTEEELAKLRSVVGGF